jgi:hypothetical protein
MPAANLQELVRQLCTIVDSPVPALSTDANGMLAFSTRLRDVDVTVTHHPTLHPEHAFVLVFFGPVPENRERAVLRELLHANLLLLHPGGPAFSRNPLSGHVVLQYVYPLAEASGQGLLSGLQTIIDSALQWRRDFFLDQAALRVVASPLPAANLSSFCPI